MIEIDTFREVLLKLAVAKGLIEPGGTVIDSATTDTDNVLLVDFGIKGVKKVRLPRLKIEIEDSNADSPRYVTPQAVIVPLAAETPAPEAEPVVEPEPEPARPSKTTKRPSKEK